MKLISCFITFFITTSINASELSDKLSKYLPEKIQAIKVAKTTETDVIKLMGKPAQIKNKTYYWAYPKHKYSLAINFNQDKVVTKINYTFFEQRPSALKLIEKIGADQLKLYRDGTKPSGKYLFYQEPNLMIIISATDKMIYTLELSSP